MSRPETNVFHPTALHFLAFEGDLDTVKELVTEHNADVNARGGLYDTPLQAAAAGGFDEIVDFLLDKEIGADPGLVGGIFGHALSAAVFSGLIRSAQDIDNLGSEQKSINHQDAQGRSALHIAAWRGNAEVFQILRSKGADVGLLDCQGRSVVHHAAIGGSVDILHQLLPDANTLRLNKTDDQGWLPLHWACRTEANRDAVSLLADKAGDSWAHIETQQCWTPESIAAFHNAIELIPEDKRTQKWGIGYCHWAYECDGCQQHVGYNYI
ncbi:ankyrin repeat-containing domain protein [Xylaria arbuscula]|nr:ankyrin repeat-containing domain protein [Xylaria arbuscula]